MLCLTCAPMLQARDKLWKMKVSGKAACAGRPSSDKPSPPVHILLQGNVQSGLNCLQTNLHHQYIFYRARFKVAYTVFRQTFSTSTYSSAGQVLNSFRYEKPAPPSHILLQGKIFIYIYFYISFFDRLQKKMHHHYNIFFWRARVKPPSETTAPPVRIL